MFLSRYKKKAVIGWYLLPCVLLLFALFINLHLLPLIADEPIRALVGLEMIINDQYLVPTINGEFYYNKPPLFNWILVSLFKLSGSMEEWVVRIPTVVSLFIYVAAIYFLFRKYVSDRVAFFTAFFTVTCGRILFYDSFLGLIDTLFSLIVFLMFFLAWHFSYKNKFTLFYVSLYALTAVAFMLKGLPAVVFLIVSILVVLWRARQLPQLFSWQHFLGILVFLLPVGLYYYLYSRHNGLDTVFSTLWQESSKRTVTETTLKDSLVHIITFPLQFVYHFLPFTLLLFLLFRKKRWKTYYQHPFLQISFWLVVTNIIVYWLSPETRPRYLFMFLPFVFVWTAYLIEELSRYRATEFIWIEKIILILQCVLPVIFLIPLFVNTLPVDDLVFKVEVMVGVSLLLLLLSWFIPARRVLMLICTLLLVRIGFNWFIFPYRAAYGSDAEFKKYGVIAGYFTQGEPLYVAKNVHLDHCLSFYISRETKRIINVLHHTLAPGESCIVLASDLPRLKFPFVRVYDFITIYGRTPLCIVKRTS